MLSYMARLGAVLMAIAVGGAFAAEPKSNSLQSVMAAVAGTVVESSAEFKAMGEAIDATRRLKLTPEIPKAAVAAAAHAAQLSSAAQTPGDFAAAAVEYDKAARLAPWVAEYQFKRGQTLVNGGRNLQASYAFALYVRAAPQAKDRKEVMALANMLSIAAGSPLADENTGQGDGGAPLTAALPSRPGSIFRECPECPEMVVIPPGSVNMGSAPAERGRFDSEGPQHNVTVGSFALGRLDVTEKEFSEFLSETGYQPAPCDTLIGKSWRSLGHGIVYPPGSADLREQPAICVNVHDVEAYITWLNRKAGNARYRLPSEAEWEYAARGGTTTSRWWGEDVGVNNANCHGCGSKWDNILVAPSTSFGPNPFDLYDILGNVWQWTADCWNESYTGAPTDGRAWTTGDCSRRVVRGGSWSNLPVFIRSASRGKADVGGKDFDLFSYVGFRVARDLY